MYPNGFQVNSSGVSRRIGSVDWKLCDGGAVCATGNLLGFVREAGGVWWVADQGGLVLGSGEPVDHLKRDLFDRGLREASQGIGHINRRLSDGCAG